MRDYSYVDSDGNRWTWDGNYVDDAGNHWVWDGNPNLRWVLPEGFIEQMMLWMAGFVS